MSAEDNKQAIPAPTAIIEPAEPTEFAESTVPNVSVRRQRWPSPVWLIPLTALLVGFWLLFQYWQQRGDVITVRFPSAEGIQAGSTEVRYKAVTVGRVKQVVLDDDLNPLVTLSLSKSISQVLGCSAQFWVVKPRVRGAEISGISTLFSGTYVGMIPARTADLADSNDSIVCYEGLEDAPVVRPSRPGREYQLVTDSMGSLDIGSPLFYKQLEVGEIIEYKLSESSGNIELGVFIDHPYYRFVNSNTRFWNASGAEFKMDSAGAEFRMESLTSLVVGGIAFDSPQEGFAANLPVSAPGTSFELHKNFSSSREKRYADRLYYTLYFNGSMRGLSEGAPVEFQGIKVGQVEKIQMHLDPESLEIRIPVLISIEPQRFSEDITLKQAPEFMVNMVDKGMRAMLQSGNLLTGNKYVSLSIEEKPGPGRIEQGQFYAVFPTSSTPVEEISKLAVGVAEDIKTTLGSISRFMESKQLDRTVDNVNEVLDETETTIIASRDVLKDVRQLLLKIQSDTLPMLPALVGDTSKVLQQLDQETLPAITRNINQVSKDASQVMQQVDQQTLPTLTRNVNQISKEVGQVMQRVDQQTLPTLARNVNQISQDVGQVMQRVDQQTLPTLARGVNRLTEDASQVLKQVDQQTLPALTRSVTSTSGTINKASTDFSRSTHQVNKTLQRLQGTLNHIDRLLAQNSPTQYQLMEMMEEVTTMARSVRLLTEQLERQPESVLRGKRELK